MNYTDTTHYLFPVESKPGVVNTLPWLDEVAQTNTVTNTENVNQNNVQSNGDALVNEIDFSNNPVAALTELQTNFTKYDTDKSESLSLEELTAASTESAAAKSAASRYRPLSQVASENYAEDGVDKTEDLIARQQAWRHVPLELGAQMFKDSIPSMMGISKQDLKTSLDFSDVKAVSTLLEGSASSERKSSWAYLATSSFCGALVYPAYKLLARIHPVAGAIGGLSAAIASFTQFGHYNARRQAKDTGHLEEQINSTRKMLGMEAIPPVTNSEKPSQEKPKEEKSIDEEKKETDPNLEAQNLQNQEKQEQTLQEQTSLNQCIEKKTSDEQSLEQNNNTQNDQTLLDQSQIQ